LKKLKVTDQILTIEKILTELSTKILSTNEVSAIFNNPIEFPKRLIEQCSLTTAIKYWNRQIDYTDGDCIMNNIFGFCTTNNFADKNCDTSGIIWECYLAFDAGEFYRPNDDRSVDPSETYTRPLIEKLLRRQKQIL
jgi:hypothetical protein